MLIPVCQTLATPGFDMAAKTRLSEACVHPGHSQLFCPDVGHGRHDPKAGRLDSIAAKLVRARHLKALQGPQRQASKKAAG
jgi:hypothetical protein